MMIRDDNVCGKSVDHMASVDIKMILDPRACTRKYLVDASVSWNLLVYVMIGMNLKRLISSPHHKNIQLDLDSTMSVLVIRVSEVRYIKGWVIGLMIEGCNGIEPSNRKLEAFIFSRYP
jgi:tRNA uridine 5-carbamoylmethylation protein Kti12